ncbi:hypothetical protein ACFQGW_01065 [Xanthomonas theicola]
MLVAASLAGMSAACVAGSGRWTSARGDVERRSGDRRVAKRVFGPAVCTTGTSTYPFWAGASRKRCLDACPLPAQGAAYAAGSAVRIAAVKDRGMVDASDPGPARIGRLARCRGRRRGDGEAGVRPPAVSVRRTGLSAVAGAA